MPLTVANLNEVIQQLHRDSALNNAHNDDGEPDTLQDIIESFRVRNMLSDEDVASKERSVSSLLMDEANSVILDIMRQVKLEDCMRDVNVDELMAKAYEVPAGKLFAEIGILLTARYMFRGMESMQEFKIWIANEVARKLIECRVRELRQQRVSNEPKLKYFDQITPNKFISNGS